MNFSKAYLGSHKGCNRMTNSILLYCFSSRTPYKESQPCAQHCTKLFISYLYRKVIELQMINIYCFFQCLPILSQHTLVNDIRILCFQGDVSLRNLLSELFQKVALAWYVWQTVSTSQKHHSCSNLTSIGQFILAPSYSQRIFLMELSPEKMQTSSL